uniref:Putative secretory peptide-41 n=1 Tax=Pleurobrachia bachei TaxID=34499 RepID=M4H265_PLEBA|nr:putative secretory peptide-41 [Pleurobrachia bachei]|eukprot:sb/3469678/
MIRLLLFTAALCGTFVLSGWTAVEEGVKIPWDLEATPLQIKTNSTLGSGDRIDLRLFNNKDSYLGYLIVMFSSPMQYGMYYCTLDWTDLPVQPPVEVDKIWKITKTETTLIVTCNDVEVLNYLFADSSKSDCVTTLGGDVVEKIQFPRYDTAITASDFYWLNCQKDELWISGVPQCVARLCFGRPASFTNVKGGLEHNKYIGNCTSYPHKKVPVSLEDKDRECD